MFIKSNEVPGAHDICTNTLLAHLRKAVQTPGTGEKSFAAVQTSENQKKTVK